MNIQTIDRLGNVKDMSEALAKVRELQKPKGKPHHPSINLIRKAFNALSIDCEYFNEKTLWVKSKLIGHHLRHGFTIAVEEQTFYEGLSIQYYKCVDVFRKDNVCFVAANAPQAIEKLIKYGFIKPVEA